MGSGSGFSNPISSKWLDQVKSISGNEGLTNPLFLPFVLFMVGGLSVDQARLN